VVKWGLQPENAGRRCKPRISGYPIPGQRMLIVKMGEQVVRRSPCRRRRDPLLEDHLSEPQGEASLCWNRKIMSAEKRPAFFDAEEREVIESFEAAPESGAVCPSPPEERAKAGAEWRALVEKASARKAITLRLEERDIERLEAIARQRGLPYQTPVSSIRGGNVARGGD
jgi:hypothetical protein